jgi:hypothetical protein
MAFHILIYICSNEKVNIECSVKLSYNVTFLEVQRTPGAHKHIVYFLKYIFYKFLNEVMVMMNRSIFWPNLGIIPTIMVNELMCIGYISHHNVPVK